VLNDVYKLPYCIPLTKRRVDLDELPLLGSDEAPPLIASLERIASLRRSGALSEHEYARLKEVLLESAAVGMAL
jgi:hypothetical protein